MTAYAKRVATALIALITVGMGAANLFHLVHWSAGQVTLVTVAAGAGAAFIVAAVQHFDRSAPPEPVAVLGTFLVFEGSILHLLNGFAIIHVTELEVGVVASLTTALVGFVGTVLARRRVQPLRGPGMGVPLFPAPITTGQSQAIDIDPPSSTP